MRPNRCRILWAALLVAPALAAENPPSISTFAERVDVEVVNVDVVVTDRSDRRVTDLAREEFELLIDGQPVPIEYFSAPRPAAPRPAPPGRPRPGLPASAASTGSTNPSLAAEPGTPPGANPGGQVARPAPAPLRYLLVFIDQSALEARTSATLIDEIREFVIPQLDGSVAVLVAAYVDSLRILGPLSTEVVEVDRALFEAKQLRGRGSSLVVERNRLELAIRGSGNVPGELARKQSFQDSERMRLDNEVRIFAESALARQRRALAALRQWVTALASIEGRKSVLLATAGFTSDPAIYLRSLLDQTQQSARATNTGLPVPVRSEPSITDSLATEGGALADAFEATVSAAENARVAFYTISPRTPPVVQTSPEFGGLGSAIAQAAPRDLAIAEAASTVVHLSAATGGTSLYVDADLSSRLARVADDETAIYSLGFTTGETAGGKPHRIEVRVRREGLTPRHRESYRRRTLADRANEALAAAVSLRTVSNPLGIGLELGGTRPEAKGGKGSIVPLQVRIPLRGLALVPGSTGLRGRLSARVAIQDARGDVRFGGVSPLDVVVAMADASQVATHNWGYRADLRLAPGANRVAVVVVDELSGSLATVTSTVEVPKP